DVLARALLDRRGDVVERPAVHPALAAGDDAGADELARDEPDTTGLLQVGRYVAAERLQVGDDRRPAGDRVEVLELERDAGLPRDREQVEHAVRRAARAGDRGDRVLERLAREDRRRPRVRADELHRELAGLARGLVLPGMRRGDAGEAARRDAEE